MSRLVLPLHAVVAASLLALGGCEVFKRNEEAVATVSGRALGTPAGEFFDRYGRATSRKQAGGSDTVYEWMSDQGMTAPGPGGQDDRFCRLRLTVGKDGRINAVVILFDAQGIKSSSRCAEIFAAK